MRDMEIVIDGNASTVRVAFLDADGMPMTPVTAEARIVCDEDGTEVRAPTSISPLTTVVDLDITAAENALVDPTRAQEHRRLCVTADPGTDAAITEPYVWRVARRAGCV